MKTLIIALILSVTLSFASPVAFAAKILLSEIVVSPTASEFIEIHNPTSSSIDLTNYWLADSTNYHLVSQGASPISSDFIIRFPAGALIAANGFIVVSLEGATSFQSAYGFLPDFDLDSADAGAPAMLGAFTGSSGLTNTAELVASFVWDGSSDLVTDVDYLLYGNNSNAVDKTGVTAGTSSYLNDTAVTSQDFALAPGSGQSLQRINLSEGSQLTTGGNGITGGDETSENLSATWAVFSTPTPGAAVVPVPGAAWLFGSALGLLGWMRRRAT